MGNEEKRAYHDDRHVLIRFFVWMEETCPWVHLPLFAILLVACAVLIGRLLDRSPLQDAKLSAMLITGCVLACGAYLVYIVRLGWSMLNALKPIRTVEAKIVALRCETMELGRYSFGRRQEIDFYYAAFKPLDGSPYIDLPIRARGEYIRLFHGMTGTLRYRGRQYLSFEQSPLTTAQTEGERP